LSGVRDKVKLTTNKGNKKMMTRQHFEKVASLLKEFRDEIPQTTFEEIVMEFGDLFLAENERFDDAKFQAACGITWPTFVRL